MAAILISCGASAQTVSTFSLVQNIIQANCSASGCHGGGSANVFDAEAAADDLYDALVGVDAVNPVAAAKGNKIVDPGHPYNSFLLRKIGSNNFDPYIKIEAAERNGHPFPLQNAEIELIRQWIIAGAPQTGAVVDYPLLQDYYTNGGEEFIPVPTPPAAGKGFQLRMGPIFLAPNDEVEFMKKENLKNPESIKISAMDGYMTLKSHHLLLFKSEQNDNFRQGLRRVPFEGFPFNGGRLTGAWQDDGLLDLPAGTAFTWEPYTTLDFDYHITNRGSSQILPADFYLNVYYYDTPDEPIEMIAELINKTDLFLSLGDNFVSDVHIPNRLSTDPEHRNIWLITSHTHKFGTDFDIYIRNPDGSKGEKIYEGFYDPEYRFDQGYYDWSHPAIRKFPVPLKKFRADDGLIFEARYNVTACTSPFPCNVLGCVCFGLTTESEMMLFTYLYTKEDIPTGIEEVGGAQDFSVRPNPLSEAAEISYSLHKAAHVKVEVFDVLGKKVGTLVDKRLAAGTYSDEFDTEALGNNTGIYFVTLSLDDNKLATRKITKL